MSSMQYQAMNEQTILTNRSSGGFSSNASGSQLTLCSSAIAAKNFILVGPSGDLVDNFSIN